MSRPREPYGPGVDGPEVGQGIDAPWLDDQPARLSPDARLVEIAEDDALRDRMARDGVPS